MWDFSGDEGFFLLAASIVSIVGAARYVAMVSLRRFVPTSFRAILIATPIVSLVPTFIVLNTIADPVNVVGHPDYILLFMVGGVAWIVVSVELIRLLGFDSVGALLERRNPASLAVTVGATLGVSLAYAGGNVGYGPTIWTTLIPAHGATATLFALGGILASDVSEAVTIDRDVATGVRTAALWIANGAILGRAMAGDFIDWSELWMTFFRRAWPALSLTLAMSAVHLIARPTPRRAKPSVREWGVIPGVVVLLAATVYVLSLGRPEVARR